MNCKAVVGIYGVSGCGKSHLLSSLQVSRPEWRCLEGSQVIATAMSEQGKEFKDFHSKSSDEKEELRNRAVKIIQRYPGVTIVAGHCSFPVTGSLDDEMEFNDVFTKGDGETFDVILYLDKDPFDICSQREQDNETCKRSRPTLSVNMIGRWIEHEKKVLERECNKHGIHFAILTNETQMESYISAHVVKPLVKQEQTESERSLASAIGRISTADVFILIDGDRTLCPMDTGKVFIDRCLGEKCEDPLKKIFKRYDGYSFQAFLEVGMFYANLMPTSDYEALSCEIGRDHVVIYDEWVRFLTRLPPRTHAIVVTSGNREIWRAALDCNNLDGVTLLAGNHIGLHSYIVDSLAKAFVITELRDLHGGCKIISFGDSAVDIPMLCASDRGYIAIDHHQNRSLKDFIHEQVISGGPRHLYQLNLLTHNSFLHHGIQVGSLERLQCELSKLDLHRVMNCATGTAANILATQSRRSDLNGPELQGIHVKIGRFLAGKLLDEVGRHGLLTDQASYSHVQGGTFHGLVSSGNVLIIPLMRGGEPMSRGVYQRFPRARMVHFYDNDAKNISQAESVIRSSHTKDVIIVDSVVNEGRSVRRVLTSLNDRSRLRIYVLTAVMQHEASIQLPKAFPRVRFLTLRVSSNKYSGKGGTDTGNRLFGTY